MIMQKNFYVLALLLLLIVGKANAQCDGGSVRILGGNTSITAPVSDPALDFIVENTSTATSDYAYVITDNDGNILGFPPANEISISGAPAGICRVYGISFTGDLDTDTDHINDLTSNDCSDISENYITVTRTTSAVDGGSVLTLNNMDHVRDCAGGDELEFTVKNTSVSSAAYAYIITDDMGNILAFPTNNELNLRGAPAGTCRVYGISYTGTLDLGATTIASLSSDDEFELSENFITAVRDGAEGGMVSIIGGGTEVSAPAGDASLDFEVENTSTASSNYAYVITDNNGNILGFPPANEISISGAPVGICRVYGISFTGDLDTDVDHINDLSSDACSNISENYILVTRTTAAVDGGHVLTLNDKDFVRDCAGGDRLEFIVKNTSTSSSAYAYVITDNMGNILAFPSTSELNLRAAPAGICRVYGFSYTGTLDLGATTIASLSSDDEYELSENYIKAYRDEAEGGMVNIIGAGDTITAQAGDLSLNFEVETSSTTDNPYAYVITDNSGNILGFPPSNSIMIAGAPIGTCYVYGFSYNGDLDSSATDIVTLSASGCFELSENWIVVIRTPPTVDGGAVYTDDQVDYVMACAGSNELTFDVINSSTANSQYAYVITDDMDNILGFPMGSTMDLSGAPAGVCRIYGFSYTGMLDSTASTISALTSDDEYELSDNFITAYRQDAEGGMVNIIGAGDTISAQAGDLSLNFEVETSSTTDNPYAYVITDNNGNILGFPPSNSIMIAGAPVGTCYVYGFSYNGDLDSSAANIADLSASACYGLSENWIVVIRTAPTVDGSSVYTDDQVDYVMACAGSDELVFDVINNSAANAQYAYVITDDMDNILGFPMGSTMDLSGAPAGVCRIYGFSYTGMLDSTASTISALTSDDEYELSDNFITAYRQDAEGGMVNIIGAGDTIAAQAGDLSLNFEVETSSATDNPYAYVITDNNGNILGFPPSNSIMIAGAPVGTCYVYGFSYNGDLDSSAANIADLSANGCFELSENWIVVIRSVPTVDGGSVYTDDQVDYVMACAGSDELVFDVINNSAANAQYAYVITDDMDNILGLPMGSTMDLSGAPAGVCRIYGFSYTGMLDSTASTISALTSDNEYELSDNFITAYRDDAEGGMVTIVDGGDTITAPMGDLSLNFKAENNSSSSNPYAYVITDDNGNILGFPPSDSIMIAGAPAGTCYVYGFSYNGDLDSSAVNIADLSASGCYELSENWIVVRRTVISAINDAIDLGIHVYPNPFEDHLNFEGTPIQSIRFIDVNGIEVLSVSEGFSTINSSDLPKGIYLAHITLLDGQTAIIQLLK